MPHKILVVEDEPDLILVIVERLKSAGYDVLSATNGRDALNLITKNIPDLIVTDVIMPELDGFGLFKELQKNPTTKDIPVIILTARGKMSDTFASIGVADFLTKPFDDAIFLEIIKKRLLERQTHHKKTDEQSRKIPAVLGSPQKSAPTKPITQAKKFFIAYVDHHAIKRMSQQLTDLMHYVEATNNFSQIISKVNALSPDIIIIEIPFEDDSGKKIIENIKKSTSHKKTPILLFSFLESTAGGTDTREKALSIDAAKEECFDAGATEYLSSYHETTFIKAISKYL